MQEGDHPFRPERKKGPTPILKPIVEHSHTEFRSLTGGFVYHGKKLPELQGAYIYGDYDTGRVWMLRYDTKAKQVTRAQGTGEDPLADRRLGAGRTKARCTPSTSSTAASTNSPPRRPRSGGQAEFPRKLSETGLFSDTASAHARRRG